MAMIACQKWKPKRAVGGSRRDTPRDVMLDAWYSVDWRAKSRKVFQQPIQISELAAGPTTRWLPSSTTSFPPLLAPATPASALERSARSSLANPKRRRAQRWCEKSSARLSVRARSGVPSSLAPTQYYFADGRGPSIDGDGIGQNMREVGETGATSLAPHRSRQLESCSELRRAIWLFRRGVPRAIFTERW